VALPDEQDIVPVMQGSPGGVQGAPSTHTPHAPLLQTLPVPQGVPLATFVTSPQAGAPLVHEIVPCSQMFPPGWQGLPADGQPVSERSASPEASTPTSVIDASGVASGDVACWSAVAASSSGDAPPSALPPQ
jgi:hypothetical protein